MNLILYLQDTYQTTYSVYQKTETFKSLSKIPIRQSITEFEKLSNRLKQYKTTICGGISNNYLVQI